MVPGMWRGDGVMPTSLCGGDRRVRGVGDVAYPDNPGYIDPGSRRLRGLGSCWEAPGLAGGGVACVETRPC